MVGHSEQFGDNIGHSVRSSTESLDSVLYDVRPFANTPVLDAPRTKQNLLLSRTSSIIDAIRDDNDITRKETRNTIEPTPFFNNDDDEIHSQGVTVAHDEEQKETEIAAIGTLDSYSDTQTSPRGDDDGEFNIQDLIDRPPDGTFWGWTAAVCVCMINCFSWGANSAFGVYLNFYMKSNTFPGVTVEEFSLIGGLALGLSFMLVNFSVVLVKRFDVRIIMFVGLIIEFASYWLASIAKTITQLIIFQGFLMAIGFALVAGPSFIIIPL